jgi:hypothetical protein
MNFLPKRFPSLGTALLLGLAATTPSAFAAPPPSGSIYLAVGRSFGGVNPYQYGDGGEFTAFSSTLGVPAGYSSLATFTMTSGSSGYSLPGGDGAGSIGDTPFVGQTGFETFCLEDQVDFYVGQSYNYTIGYAIQQTNGSLTAGAAWLYEQFATGQLSGYDYSDDSAHLTDAGELQSTLWYLQGEPADPSVFPNDASDPFTTLVENHFGGGAAGLAAAQATITSASNDPYDVEVLELSNSSGIAQDQLIYTGPAHVPDSATTLGLLGISLVGLVSLTFLKRRPIPLRA